MKAINAIKAMERSGLSPVCVSPSESVYNKMYHAESNGRRLILSTQGDEVATIRVHGLSDHDEPQSDYCAGSFFDTMKSALNYMLEQRKETASI